MQVSVFSNVLINRFRCKGPIFYIYNLFFNMRPYQHTLLVLA